MATRLPPLFGAKGKSIPGLGVRSSCLHRAQSPGGSSQTKSPGWLSSSYRRRARGSQPREGAAVCLHQRELVGLRPFEFLKPPKGGDTLPLAEHATRLVKHVFELIERPVTNAAGINSRPPSLPH